MDFINVAEGVYVVSSSNVSLLDSRYQNITGPYERVGLNRANLIQVNGLTGGTIARNKGKCGDTEDIVSVYKSSNVIIEDNHFEGVYESTAGCLAWRSSSGTCIISGDGAGNGNIIRRNICVNPGQVGIAIAGGQNNRIESNIVIGQRRSAPDSNVGIYIANYSSGTCANNAVWTNRVWWRNAAGSSNGAYLPSSCSGTDRNPGDGLTPDSNVWNDSTLDIEDYRVVFP